MAYNRERHSAYRFSKSYTSYARSYTAELKPENLDRNNFFKCTGE